MQCWSSWLLVRFLDLQCEATVTDVAHSLQSVGKLLRLAQCVDSLAWQWIQLIWATLGFPFVDLLCTSRLKSSLVTGFSSTKLFLPPRRSPRRPRSVPLPTRSEGTEIGVGAWRVWSLVTMRCGHALQSCASPQCWGQCGNGSTCNPNNRDIQKCPTFFRISQGIRRVPFRSAPLAHRHSDTAPRPWPFFPSVAKRQLCSSAC